MTMCHEVVVLPASEKAGDRVIGGSSMPFGDEFLHQLLRIHVTSGRSGFRSGPTAGGLNHRSIGPIRVALDGVSGPRCIGHMMSVIRG